MAVAVSAEQQADSFIHAPHKLLIDGSGRPGSLRRRYGGVAAAWRALGPAPAESDA